MHPRDFLVPGRVRVELKDNEGKLIGQVRSRAWRAPEPRAVPGCPPADAPPLVVLPPSGTP